MLHLNSVVCALGILLSVYTLLQLNSTITGLYWNRGKSSSLRALVRVSLSSESRYSAAEEMHSDRAEGKVENVCGKLLYEQFNLNDVV